MDPKRIKLGEIDSKFVNSAPSNHGLQDMELLSEFEKRKKSRTIPVPTDKAAVQSLLRYLSQPICLFGEGPAERRDRLKDVLAGLDDEVVREALSHKEIIGSAAQQEDVVSEGDDDEVWYYPGSKDLKNMRMNVALFSLQRAQNRLKMERLFRARPPPDWAGKTQELYNKLRSIGTTSSQIGDNRPLSYCQFSPDSQLLATSSWSGLCKVWTVPDSKPLLTYRGHKERATCVIFHPHSRTSLSETAANVFSSGSDGIVNAWSLHDSNLVAAFQGHSHRVSRLACHPNGSLLATTCHDHSWRLFDISTQQELLFQEGHSQPVYDVAFQSDGSLVATCGLDRLPRVWDLRTGKCISLLVGHVNQVLSVTFSPNGYQLATGGEDNSIRIWDLRLMRGPNAPSSVGERKYISTNNFNSIYMIPAHINLVSSVKYEPVYGRYLVSSSYDTFCKVWAYQSWAPVRSLEGHEGKVMALDVSPGK
eukprot:Sdes_comp15997_c0_seq3m5170